MSGSTLSDQLWDAHVVHGNDNEQVLFCVALHLLHEISTPQAFATLREAGHNVRRPDRRLAVVAEIDALENKLANIMPWLPAKQGGVRQ